MANLIRKYSCLKWFDVFTREGNPSGIRSRRICMVTVGSAYAWLLLIHKFLTLLGANYISCSHHFSTHKHSSEFAYSAICDNAKLSNPRPSSVITTNQLFGVLPKRQFHAWWCQYMCESYVINEKVNFALSIYGVRN